MPWHKGPKAFEEGRQKDQQLAFVLLSLPLALRRGLLFSMAKDIFGSEGFEATRPLGPGAGEALGSS